MKKYIRIILLFVIVNNACNYVQAQRGVELTLDYNIATPLRSDFKDYTNRTSVRGGQASVLYNFNSQFKAGLQGSFNNFYQKHPRQVYKTTDGAYVSTVLSNTLQVVPLVIKGEYSFLKNGFFKPYVGLGAGINFINFDQFVGELEYNVNYTRPAFTGDVGVMIPFKKNSNYGFRISTSYNLMPFNKEGINRLDTWNAQVGITVPLK